MKSIVLLISILLLSIGCIGFTDQAITRGTQTGQIKIGASKQEVISVTGYPVFGCIKTRQKEDGTYEMWDFATRWCGTNWSASYVLIFRDDKLIEIRTVKDRLDMQF